MHLYLIQLRTDQASPLKMIHSLILSLGDVFVDIPQYDKGGFISKGVFVGIKKHLIRIDKHRVKERQFRRKWELRPWVRRKKKNVLKAITALETKEAPGVVLMGLDVLPLCAPPCLQK